MNATIGYVLVLPDRSVRVVDEGDVEAAKLLLELSKEAGQKIDPAVEAIANAKPDGKAS